MFNSIGQHIHQSIGTTGKGKLAIEGVSNNQWQLLLQAFSDNEENFYSKNNHLIICPDIDIAEDFYERCKSNRQSHKVYFYPGLDHSPYSSFFQSESDMQKRFNVLDKITHSSEKLIIISTFESLFLKVPNQYFFQGHNFSLSVSDIISPMELKEKLIALGYQYSPSLETPGTFSSKGEIFDIHLSNGRGIRINYFDDMIEEIFYINTKTLISDRKISYDSIDISFSSLIFGKEKFHQTLRENIPQFGPQFKSKFEHRKNIFRKLSSENLFENFPVYTPLFLKESTTLFGYIENDFIFHILNHTKSIQNIYEYADSLNSEFDEISNDVDSDCVLPSPDKLYSLNLDLIDNLSGIYVNEVNIVQDFNKDCSNSISVKFEHIGAYLKSKFLTPSLKHEFIKQLFSFIKDEFSSSGQILFTYSNNNSKKEFDHLLEIFEIPSELQKRITSFKSNLDHGFFYKNEKTLVLSEADIFSQKKTKSKKIVNKDVDLFAEQMASLRPGDFVMHSELGVAKFEGMQSLDVGDTKTDYLVLIYANNDKVYLPVYKMNLIQKHANSSAQVRTENLRTNKFIQAKNKARASVKKLAFDFLKLQAERKTSDAFSFSPPDELYKEFELSFPFTETPDQASAIENILNSMQKNEPMDHLVCGDVGFGKTEMAMRAAFKAVLDKKQVAVLCPTTVLTLQHYNSFSKRFKNFPVNIEFLSRFKSAKESKDILKDIESGKIDIIIGTHKLLSDKIKYSDLGLVIVDEEQRFGVGHKEKLKLLKTSVDFLTLSATPIPRTLQQSFLGIRELSLIRTAPPKRQSIKSFVIKKDGNTIKTAIEKELNRGGQIFIVHNKVQDIEIFVQEIRQLVPSARIVFAHGQLPEKELQKRMEDFYRAKYDILIATTIIESGIDIPNANTMIIDRADHFGLAQLHQLRGRIGRSDKKAYCYFMISDHNALSNVAEKRLKALQTYADIGSGFNIASCDLEIRGAGDILGANQSGHIDSIGLELYMKLLKEAISELKGEKKIIHHNLEVSTPHPAYIPNGYIEDTSQRLKFYKELSNTESLENLEILESELVDIFGAPPAPLRNLINILKSRISFQKLGLTSVKCNNKTAILKFDNEIINSDHTLRDNLVELCLKRPNSYQVTPDYKVIFNDKKELTPESLLEFSHNLSEKILPNE